MDMVQKTPEYRVSQMLPLGNPFELSDEQSLMCETVARFLRELADVGAAGRGPLGRPEWRSLMELGVAVYLLPEAAGGMGGSNRDAALMAEEFGRALAITPFSETIVGAARLVARHGSEHQIDRWISPTIEGSSTIALAASPVDISGNGLVSGTLPLVRWASDADGLLVLGSERAALISADAAGLRRECGTMIDGTRVANVQLDRVVADILPLPAGTVAAMIAGVQLCYVAEMVGTMATLHEQTVEYTKQRQQFGMPIARFQVVQHKLARMFVRLEQARSMLLKAAICPEDDLGFIRHVTAAKAYVAASAQLLAEDAVQLHGGMGITDELLIGRGLRRITVLARLFGSAESARHQLSS